MVSRVFGHLPSGEPVDCITLSNATGASVDVITWGAIITSLRVPDRHGRLADVVLGFNDLAGYLRPHPYFGAMVGPIAGRVTGGRLQLRDRTHLLACNSGPHHLHGGFRGLDKRLWTAGPASPSVAGDAVRLACRSPDGEEGYPGEVRFAVTYALTAAGELSIETEAISSTLTAVSLAHHSYFNLDGEGSGSIAGHELQIVAPACIPVSDTALTLSGRREPVAGTEDDLNAARRLEDVLPRLFLRHGALYHLRGPYAGPPPSPTVAAQVYSPASGRLLEVRTDESCLQFYSGASLDGSVVGKSGRPYGAHAGLCLECQGYPDGASRPEFGDILVRAGLPQRRRTIYAFSTP